MQPMPPRRIGTIVVALVLAALSLTSVLDGQAQSRHDGVFRSALLTFAAARGLDAAISLAQGTEIAMQPAGVGLTLSAGELLDPINDLVEQLSSVLLVATTSLGLQGLLLRASSWWVLRWLAAVGLLAWLTGTLWPERLSPRASALLRRAVLLLLVARFALPAYALVTGLVFDRFLQPAQLSSVQLIEDATEEVRAMPRIDEELPLEDDRGWLDGVSSWFSETMASLDVEARIEAFRARVAAVAEQVVQLIVVFVLQTIVLPLAFLWAVPKLIAALLAPTAPR